MIARRDSIGQTRLPRPSTEEGLNMLLKRDYPEKSWLCRQNSVG